MTVTPEMIAAGANVLAGFNRDRATLEDGAAEILEAGLAASWQLIGTAPTGERILVWDGARVMLANDQTNGCFFTDDGDIITEPTHWMPLLETPID